MARMLGIRSPPATDGYQTAHAREHDPALQCSPFPHKNNRMDAWPRIPDGELYCSPFDVRVPFLTRLTAIPRLVNAFLYFFCCSKCPFSDCFSLSGERFCIHAKIIRVPSNFLLS